MGRIGAIWIDDYFRELTMERVRFANSGGNIIRLMKNILDLLEVSNNKTLAIPGRAKQSVMEHECIIEAIKQGNCEDAKEAMQMHLHSIEDSLKANQQ